jgi:flagellar hook protein FlgE
MALTSALFTGLSGLDVNTTQMNVVGNNIANANTTAFKSSRVLFTPQFYVTDQAGTPPSADNGGSNPSQRGLGASVASIEQDFTPGAIQATGVDTDLAIDGSGFFVIKSAGNQQYTRNGAFTLNSNNQLVTNTGAFVQGFTADAKGAIVPGQLGTIQIPVGTSALSAPTTDVTLKGNLDASGIPAAGASILTSEDLTLVGGAAAPAATDLLTNVADASDSATPLFNDGDTLTLTGTKGGRTLPAQTLNVTAATTVQDLLDFYNQSLGIDTTAANPNVPVPGAAIENDPANPTASQLVITGNEGTADALEINTGAFNNQNGLPPVTFSDGTDPTTGIVSDPSGESVHTSFTAYDSLGNSVNVDVTAVLENTSSSGNTWRFLATSNDNKVGGTVLGNGTLTFDSQGNLKASTGTNISIDRTGTGAQSPMSVNLDFSNMTELSGQNSSLVVSNQDGMPPGTLASFSIGVDGTITGAYSNGLTRPLGQVAVASFANPDGLNNVGGNVYAQGANSGVAVISAPEQLGTGAVRSGALELSNVDLSKEFTNLIIASTGFSASSKVITTSDQLIQELLNSQR